MPHNGSVPAIEQVRIDINPLSRIFDIMLATQAFDITLAAQVLDMLTA